MQLQCLARQVVVGSSVTWTLFLFATGFDPRDLPAITGALMEELLILGVLAQPQRIKQAADKEAASLVALLQRGTALAKEMAARRGAARGADAEADRSAALGR